MNEPESVYTGSRLRHVTCEWCGVAVPYSGRGRPPAYCSRAHRQRAYELRTALARYVASTAAGEVRLEPVQRVIERTIEPKVPNTTSGWVEALAALAAQLRDGQLAWRPWHHDRLFEALTDALRALDDAAPAGLTYLDRGHG